MFVGFSASTFGTELDARAGARNVSDEDTTPIWDCFKVEWLWSHGTVARDSWPSGKEQIGYSFHES